MDGLKRYVNDDRFRVDGDKNMRLLAFACTIVFVWTGPKLNSDIARFIFTTHLRTCLATSKIARFVFVGGKMRNIANH